MHVVNIWLVYLAMISHGLSSGSLLQLESVIIILVHFCPKVKFEHVHPQVTADE